MLLIMIYDNNQYSSFSTCLFLFFYVCKSSSSSLLTSSMSLLSVTTTSSPSHLSLLLLLLLFLLIMMNNIRRSLLVPSVKSSPFAVSPIFIDAMDSPSSSASEYATPDAIREVLVIRFSVFLLLIYMMMKMKREMHISNLIL